MTSACLVSLLTLAAPIAPTGDAEPIKWRKGTTGHVLSSDGLTFAVTGPTHLRFELRGRRALKGKTVSIDIERDGNFLSHNERKLKRKGGGPRSHPGWTRIDLAVPEGEHIYVVRADGRLTVAAATSKALGKRWAAAEETVLEGDASPEDPGAAEALASREASEDGAADADATAVVNASTEVPLDVAPQAAAALADGANAPDGGQAAADAAAGSAAREATGEVMSSEGSVNEDDAAVMDPQAKAAGLTDIAAAAPANATGLDRATRVAVYSLELEGIDARHWQRRHRQPAGGSSQAQGGLCHWHG